MSGCVYRTSKGAEEANGCWDSGVVKTLPWGPVLRIFDIVGSVPVLRSGGNSSSAGRGMLFDVWSSCSWALIVCGFDFSFHAACYHRHFRILHEMPARVDDGGYLSPLACVDGKLSGTIDLLVPLSSSGRFDTKSLASEFERKKPPAVIDGRLKLCNPLSAPQKEWSALKRQTCAHLFRWLSIGPDIECWFQPGWIARAFSTLRKMQTTLLLIQY